MEWHIAQNSRGLVDQLLAPLVTVEPILRHWEEVKYIDHELPAWVQILTLPLPICVPFTNDLTPLLYSPHL